MTLDELDDVLRKMNLDLSVPQGQAIRDRILADYGKDMLKANSERCSRCWLKENNQCHDTCPVKTTSDNPLIAARDYLSKPNNVNLMSFVSLFVIPVYEEITGDKDFLNRLHKSYMAIWSKTYGKKRTPTEF